MFATIWLKAVYPFLFQLKVYELKFKKNIILSFLFGVKLGL